MGTLLRGVSGPLHGDDSNTVQVILHGSAVDLVFNAAGGLVVSVGPWNTSCLRFAMDVSNYQAVRVWHGPAGALPDGVGTLMIFPGVEHMAITPGDWVFAISNNTSGGSLNIVPAN